MFTSIGVPHGFCFLWNPGLLWLHVLSDSFIALAYFLIPIVLLRIVARRKDIPYNGILLCFGAFIVACGITHILEVVTLWHPIYWASGAMKAVTAAISLTTFVLLVRLAPAVVALPSTSQLADANLRLNTVLESTTAGVAAYDREWRMIYLNSNAKKIAEARGPVLGRTMFEAFPEMSQESVAHMRRVMEQRSPVQYESYFEPFDLYTLISVCPSIDGGITVFFDDISVRKRLERELQQERSLREQRVEALAQMASGLAHEISNPLGIIHARASDLLETVKAGEAISPPEVAETCASIVRTSDRAMRILRGLRMFAREGSQDPLEVTEVAPLIQQTVELVLPRFRTLGIELSINLPPLPLFIACREVQIGQILLNLLNNAFDAIGSHPSRLEVSSWVRIDMTTDQDHVTLAVLDSGPGVSPENRVHLMKPFFTTKPLGSGIGVGLSLSRAIAQDHGGTLVLAEGSPTCFRLTLPRAAVAVQGAA